MTLDGVAADLLYTYQRKTSIDGSILRFQFEYNLAEEIKKMIWQT